jgi:type IX secretion system PorP/SprF family membrane protein
MKYTLIFILFFSSICFISNAQDPIFSNSQQSLLYLNPSFAGSNGNVRFQSIFSNQTLNSLSTYFTTYNGFDIYLKKIKGGLGLTYLKDYQANGALVTDRIDLTYAQHFSLLNKKLKITPSLQVTYLQKHLDKTKIFYDYQPHPNFISWTQNEAVPFQTKRNFDLSSGLIINYKHFYFGSSVFHINQPDEGLLMYSRLNARINLFASQNISIGKKIV